MNNIEQNLLVLTIYILTVLYVFYRAMDSLDDKVMITLDTKAINDQLMAQGLKDLVDIKIPLNKQYQLESLKQLTVILENKAKQTIIYIDWDRSGLSDFTGEMRRLIRVIPGMMFDVFQPQVNTAVMSGRKIKQIFTAEDVLHRESDTSYLKIKAPLFDLSKFKKGNKLDKKIYTDFMNQKTNLQFSLGLVLRVLDLAQKNEQVHIIVCNFTVKRMYWKEAITWKVK
jgi:hypothetical protein